MILLFIFTDELTEVENITALKCVASFLLPKRKKQDKDNNVAIPLLLIDVPVCSGAIIISDLT